MSHKNYWKMFSFLLFLSIPLWAMWLPGHCHDMANIFPIKHFRTGKTVLQSRGVRNYWKCCLPRTDTLKFSDEVRFDNILMNGVLFWSKPYSRAGYLAWRINCLSNRLESLSLCHWHPCIMPGRYGGQVSLYLEQASYRNKIARGWSVIWTEPGSSAPDRV